MARRSPYKGLDPFDEQDASFFFGRERDVKLITATALTSASVLLYGPSGVGKSSVVLAGVVPRLRERPSVLVGVCREWSGDPAGRLGDAVATAAREAGHDVTPIDGGLVPLLEECATALKRRIVLVFDQFEDRLAEVVGTDPFVEELADALAIGDLPLSVVIVIREESLARLDRLEGYVPGLFETVYRLDHLDREAGSTAIRGPLEAWNAEVGTGEAVTLEDELVVAVLDDIPSAEDPARIETAHLQLVMQRVWDAEQDLGSHTLRMATFVGLGGAETIVHEHVTQALDGLDSGDRALASDVLDRLVAPSGARMAQTPADLAVLASSPLERVQSLLDRLARARVLRPVSRPEGGEAFEVFHPSLADAALAWRTQYVAERRAAGERARARRWLIVAVVLALVLALVTGLGAYAWTQRQTARSQAFALTAREQLERDPGLALALASGGVETKQTRGSLQALRQALQRSHERVILKGHEGAVNSVSVGSDGVLTGGADGTVRLWDAGTGEQLDELAKRTDEVTDASFCPDADRIAIAAGDGVLLLAGDRETVLDHGAATADAVACTAEGTLVATAGTDGVARVFTSDGTRIRAFGKRGDGLTDVAWSSDGSRLAVAHADGAIRVWELDARQPTTRFRVRTEPSLAFEPDGHLIVGDSSGSVEVVDTADVFGAVSRQAPLAGHVSLVTAVAASPDGALVASASASGDGVRLWNATIAGDELGRLQGHDGKVNDVAFAPDGRTVVTAGKDGTARVWQAPATVVLRGHTRAIRSVGANGDGSRIVTAGRDDAGDPDTVRVWDVANGDELARLDAPGVEAASISPTGTHALIRGPNLTVRIWEIGRSPRTVSLPSGFAAAFAPDGTSVAIGGVGPVRLFALDGRPLRRLVVPGPAGVAALAYSPDGTRLAVAKGGEISLVDVATGKEVVQMAEGHEGARSLSFSRDGERLVSAGADNSPRIWDATTGKLLETLDGTGARVLRATFDPGASIVLTSDEGERVRLWDVATGRELASYPGVDAAFVPTGAGTLIAVVGQKGNAYVLRCELCGSPGELRERARERLTRTAAERDRALG